jgi:hypothetical protein
MLFSVDKIDKICYVVLGNVLSNKEKEMIIPKTDLCWTNRVQSEEYDSVLHEVQNRPIVAWFCDQRPCVYQLHKVTARLGDNLWIVTGHDYNEEAEWLVTISPTTLRKALRYLTKENGWTMCEFNNGLEFHQAVISYLS